MSEIRDLCLKYTSLKESDILIIENIATTLQLIADSANANVFIDCPTKHSGEAIVVAEAKPSTKNSLYKEKVVGKFAERQNEPASLRTLELGVPSRDLKAITQEHIKVKQNVEPIRNRENKTIGVLIVEKDITETLSSNRKLEILAKTNEELTSQIANRNYKESDITYHINDAILIFDENGVLRFKNPVAEELYKKLGYKEDLVGMDFSNLSLYNCSFEEVVNNGCMDVKDIDIGDISLQVKYIVQSSKVLNLVMLISDVTDMRQKEKELILKSVVIKEIHHRVKNNLQTIASLLRLQSRRIKGEEFTNAMNESINRILSIAATHEILAKQGIDEVNIKEVINKIKASIVSVEKRDNVDLQVNIVGDDFSINSDKSTSIALVVNELLQNSLKHAFKDRTAGKITIKIEQGNIYSTISIIDDGVGFDVNSIKESSLGLMIVRSLVNDKLNGNLNIYSNSQGTTAVFDFKN
ncbi:MAG: histidine kinase N-terminal domain-containing protein [Clostridium argentinense]|uniref:histidine kinase n=1 Tax=Clostridium faecium TaxID=2762223 RepID=A0ABR8YMS7_9CLOT|nr:MULTISPECIES: histidine kinase N-terminal domain-containing protein [Clostridium]MBD8045547.1 sensor histidine kinase [Clostridium faecium]MBS5825212.1 histidine kinase N-terminal domain-containing protein [Clostridium argentinense]MDU1350342.1 histidine kinase N-terminal domain-containing protein [Clostridium argentinense]